jgi:hypothetical protein
VAISLVIGICRNNSLSSRRPLGSRLVVG